MLCFLWYDISTCICRYYSNNKRIFPVKRFRNGSFGSSVSHTVYGKKVKFLIRKKQRQIRRSEREIEWANDILSGNDPRSDWMDEDSFKRRAKEIAQYQVKIAACQEDIKLYENILSQIQALKQ